MLVARPAPESHFYDHHAECLEMFECERITFDRSQIGEAKFDIAPDDGSARAAETMCQPAENAADCKRHAMWQQTNETQ
jgi:hypothetical protein